MVDSTSLVVFIICSSWLVISTWPIYSIHQMNLNRLTQAIYPPNLIDLVLGMFFLPRLTWLAIGPSLASFSPLSLFFSTSLIGFLDLLNLVILTLLVCSTQLTYSTLLSTWANQATFSPTNLLGWSPHYVQPIQVIKFIWPNQFE